MTKKRIIMVAGWAYTKEVMEPVAMLLRKSFRINVTSVAELLRAGGAQAGKLDVSDTSDTSDKETSSHYSTALRAMIENEKAPCIVVGWSMGAMVALETALNWPLPNLERIIAVSGTAKFCATDGYSFGLDRQVLRAFRIGLSRDPDKVVGGFIADVSAPYELPPELLRKQMAATRELGVETLKAGLQYLEETDLRDRLTTLKIPVLVIHGKRDKIIPWQAGEHLSRIVPKAGFVAEDEAGHSIVLTHAERIARYIRREC